jgi:hypothetical protein
LVKIFPAPQQTRKALQERRSRRTLQDLAQMSVFLPRPVQDDHYDGIDLLPFCKQGSKIIDPFSP